MSKALYLGSMAALIPVLVVSVPERPAILIAYLIYLLGLHCHFWYSAWSSIQDEHARMGPAQIFRIFIPFYNLYWAFQMVSGFAVDFNSYLDRHGLPQPKLKTGPFEAMPVNIVIVAPMIIWRTCDAVSTLRSVRQADAPFPSVETAGGEA